MINNVRLARVINTQVWLVGLNSLNGPHTLSSETPQECKGLVSLSFRPQNQLKRSTVSDGTQRFK